MSLYETITNTMHVFYVYQIGNFCNIFRIPRHEKMVFKEKNILLSHCLFKFYFSICKLNILLAKKDLQEMLYGVS